MKTQTPHAVLRQAVRDVVDAGRRAGGLETLSEPERARLEAQVVEAFESGHVATGVELLLAHAPSSKVEQSLRRLIDSALLSLGVSVQGARQAWYQDLSKLAEAIEDVAKPASPRESPVRDAFRGIRVPLSDHSAKLLKRLAVRQAVLDKSLDLAVNSSDPLAALRSFFDEIDPADTPDSTMMGLIAAFADREAWKDVIQVYEKAGKTFRAYPQPTREYALALSMSGRPKDARRVLLAMSRKGANAIDWGLIGKLDKEQADLAREKGDTTAARQWTVRAVGAYRRGFKTEPTSLYPGINLPGLLEERGNRVEGRAFAHVLKENALRRWSYGEKNYWNAAAVVECAVSLGDLDLAETWLDKAFQCKSEPWQRNSTASNLDRMLASRTGEDADTLANIVSALRNTKGTVAGKPGDAPSTPSAAALKGLLDTTYRFGARSPRRVTGNYGLEGIAHDIRVAPADSVFFKRVLTATDIPAERDPLAASAMIDDLIRTRFGTDEMEDADSPRHEEYDKVMPGLARFMGATEDSQTNVSADWLNGLADCRQHAPVKVLLFEAWKRKQLSDTSKKMLDAHRQGNAEELPKLRARLAELSCLEMRILDARIVKKDSRELVEEHTMTLLVRRKPVPLGAEMTELAEVRLADSFYHNAYAFGEGVANVRIEDGRPIMSVPANPDIELEPAEYSKDRSFAAVDFGQLKFRGIQVGTPGWETEVPVEGIELDYLHEYVAKQA